MKQNRQSIRRVLDSNELSPLDGVGIIVFTAVAVSTQNLWGVAAGAVILAVATVTTGPAAFVAAQLWVIAYIPQESPLILAATQIAIFPLLVSGSANTSPARTQIPALAIAYGGSLALVWLLVSNLRWLWQSTLLFVIIAGSLAYAMHRYERVALGLVRTEEHQ